MHPRSFTLDPRHFQILFQAFFLAYGILFLDWKADWPHYLCSIGGCLVVNYFAESIRHKKLLPVLRNGASVWVYSALISALSLCLLLKTNHWYTSLFAACLAITSKYLFRIGKKHLFNPSGFGIVATLLLTHDAWLSPGQWGTDTVLLFLILTFGSIVVTRVQKLDSSLSFLLTYSLLLCWRQVFVLGWPLDHFFHSINTGSLLLFGFFMISDPKTSPNHPIARIAWAMLIAVTAFYLSAFKWLYNTPIWVLVAAAPLVPLLDIIFKGRSFEWAAACRRLNIYLPLKKPVMNTRLTKKVAASFILLAMVSQQASAFCGFYVSKADGVLKNKTSQVIIVHDGNRNVITMYNDFKGNQKDFAMVVPVPVVLKKSDIRVVDPEIFKTLNEYSQPRLVEYYDENPCEIRIQYEVRKSYNALQKDDMAASGMGIARQSRGVTIEAKYLVGEYDILILSAKESSGLQTWLTENGYKIPDAANEVLEPYIKSNLKFFVVKVNEKEKRKLGGNFLRPIQISFESPKFMLPIRLGMANAESDQDMIVYAFSKSGRIECANYRTVALPTGKNIPLFVQNNFNNFYANVFQHQWGKEGKSVAMLEYAWDLSPKNYLKCDPCIATVPSTQDIVQAGVWWLGKQGNDVSDDNIEASDNVYFTRLHIRYNRNAFPQDLLFEETANTENFQARYIITHPATGDLNCLGGKAYLNTLKQRRKEEMENLASLTGRGYSDWDMIARAGIVNDGITHAGEEPQIPYESSYRGVALAMDKKDTTGDKIFYGALGLAGILVFMRRPLNHKKSRPV